MAQEKRIGEMYVRTSDGSGSVRFRSRHQRRMSWQNLAAQDYGRPAPRPQPAQISSASSSPGLVVVGHKPGQQPASAPSSAATPNLRKPRAGGSRVAPRASLRAASLEFQELAGRRGTGLVPRPVQRRRSKLDKVDEVVELSRIAKVMHIPQAAVRQAAFLFRECGDTGPYSIKEWRMSKAQFTRVLCMLTNKASEQDLPENMALDAWRLVDYDKCGFLDFGKFTFWLSNNSFSEDLNLDEEQKELRTLARKHGLHYTNIEQYKQQFDELDEDGNGTIDPEEFQNLISKCGKVPRNIGLPPARLQQWWRDADIDGNGTVDFEEFISFQQKYFDPKDAGRRHSANGGRARSGFEDYYRGIRKHCWT